ncbi:hypothetical protein IWW45_000325 [Coemansia sp. RSA 485]|nr:hypothetical protein IWW45_000325 [Coemansia sp. RSA 485]KAJ2600769.1 hypothetical protein GGF39_001606 [Coemansia sp. RSA 1721]
MFGFGSKFARVSRLAATATAINGRPSLIRQASVLPPQKQQPLTIFRRPISTFHMDNTPRGKLQPYLGAIKLISLVSGSVVISILGLYAATNYYLDSNYPVPPTITRKETRRLLRGAAMREHLVPNAHIAYVFLLRALEQIYQDKQLGEESAEVQEIVVRLATAASLMGEQEPAMKMLEGCWERVADDQEVKKDSGYPDMWQKEQIGRIAKVLGPLATDKGEFDRAVQVYGVALQAARFLDTRIDVEQRDRLRAQTAGFVASLGETFALKGDYESARVLLLGLLAEIRQRNQDVGAEANRVDQWTCLDAVVMLNLAQVFAQLRSMDESSEWATSALAATAKNQGVRACDNCYTHTVYHMGTIAEAKGKNGDALVMYRKALEHGRKTKTGNIETIKSSIAKLESI